MKNRSFHEILFFNSKLAFLGHMYGEGARENGKTIDSAGIETFHLQSDWVDGSIIKDITRSISFSFQKGEHLGYKMLQLPQSKFCRKKSIYTNEIIFYLVDEKNPSVILNVET